VQNQLDADDADSPDVLDVDLLQGWRDWKSRVNEQTGLDFGFDYNILGFLSTDSLGDSGAASGAFRFYGTWDLINRDQADTGSLVFKFENRHAYTNVPPNEFGFEVGYVGLVNSVFGDQGWRTTHLYWRQNFAGGRGMSFVGFLDTTDYTDVFVLASPWTGFDNLVFQTGSGSMGGTPDGALGAMVGGLLSDTIYAVASIADANGDASNIFDGFNSFFNKFETFKTLEIGWNPNAELLFVDNAHVTFWQVDARQEADDSVRVGYQFFPEWGH
jgi:porin